MYDALLTADLLFFGHAGSHLLASSGAAQAQHQVLAWLGVHCRNLKIGWQSTLSHAPRHQVTARICIFIIIVFNFCP
jgi:hypothetical protein